MTQANVTFLSYLSHEPCFGIETVFRHILNEEKNCRLFPHLLPSRKNGIQIREKGAKTRGILKVIDVVNSTPLLFLFNSFFATKFATFGKVVPTSRPLG